MSIQPLQFQQYDATSRFQSQIEKNLHPTIREEFYKSDSIFKEVLSNQCSAELLLEGSRPVGLITYSPPKGESKNFELRSLNVIDRNTDSGKGFHESLLNRVIQLANQSFAQKVTVYIKKIEDLSLERFFEKSNFSRQDLGNHIALTYELPLREEPQVQKRKRDDDIQPDEKKRANIATDAQLRKTTSTTHSCTLKDIYIGQIQSGHKKIEGRINLGMFKKFRAGDHIRFFSQTNQVHCKVSKVVEYDTFKEMLSKSGFKNCLPNCKSLEQAAQEYEKIPGYPAKEKTYGVLAIHIEKI